MLVGCGTPDEGDAEPEVPGAVHRYVDVDEIRWHRVEAGDGVPVVFVHGLPETWFAWTEQMGALAATHRVIAVDLPGFGFSSKREGDYSIAAVAAGLGRMLSAIDVERFYLVGHDLGGLVAARLAGDAPARVIAYAHVAAPYRRLDLARAPDLRDFHLDPHTAPPLVRTADLFVRRLLDAGVFGGSEMLDPQRVERHVWMFLRRGVPASMERWFRDLDLARDGTLGPTARPDWQAMTFPMRVLVGDRDLQVPLEEYLGIEQAVPGFRGLEIIDNAGHYPHEEQPQVVSDILRRLFDR